MSARCQTCKAPMLWLKNDKTGKPAPIDEESLPADEANILVDLATGTYRVMARLEERTAMGPRPRVSYQPLGYLSRPRGVEGEATTDPPIGWRMNPGYLRQLRDRLTVLRVEYAGRTAMPERYLDYRLLDAVIELCDQVAQVEVQLDSHEHD